MSEGQCNTTTPEIQVRLHTPAEVQQILCLGRSRLWNEMRLGRLRYVTNGKRRYIRSDEVRRYIDRLSDP